MISRYELAIYKLIAKNIEAPSEENNELPKEPNKIWDFVKREYNNDKEEMNESKNYYLKS